MKLCMKFSVSVGLPFVLFVVNEIGVKSSLDVKLRFEFV